MDTSNAKDELQELIEHLSNQGAELVAVDVTLHTEDSEAFTVQFIADKVDKGIEELLSPLDKEYDSGYGTQNLYGTVWFTKGIWAERCEYDGSEWWGLNVYPPLPNLDDEYPKQESNV
jgi:hypothetical protein